MNRYNKLELKYKQLPQPFRLLRFQDRYYRWYFGFYDPNNEYPYYWIHLEPSPNEDIKDPFRYVNMENNSEVIDWEYLTENNKPYIL